MSDDDKIYEPIWGLDEDSDTFTEKPKPPPRNGSLKIHLSESDDTISECCKSFEGESIDNLDIPLLRFPVLNKMKYSANSTVKSLYPVPFPKKPCFSEFDDNDKLEYHGPITQIVQKLTSNKKSRYAVLISNRLILFEKPEHKVSKIQIPLTAMIGIDWYDNLNCSSKNDCNKFRLETPIRSYKFQCSSHESAGLWINHIGKLIFNKQNIVDPIQNDVLKASVLLENVKGKRIFSIESRFTVAYYETEEDYKCRIAMHRIQLRSSGVKREGNEANSLSLITSYRKYNLSFESASICNEWFQALSTIIQKAISSTSCSKTSKSGDQVMQEICRNPSNKFCAECGSPEIEWASINLFITLCRNCCGLHRGLGPNVSRIQGILTDESHWENSALIRLFHIIGNARANEFWMASATDSPVFVNKQFIQDKYSRKKFIERRESICENYKDPVLLNEQLVCCVATDNVLRTMRLFHIGADLSYVNPGLGIDVTTVACQAQQQDQVTFLNQQSRTVAMQDWRDEMFDDETSESPGHQETAFEERSLLCSINDATLEPRSIRIKAREIHIDGDWCVVPFKNMCLVREKQQVLDCAGSNGGDRQRTRLVLTTRDCEYSWPAIAVHSIELGAPDNDLCSESDLRDFKHVLGQNMCRDFELASSYRALCWVIMSSSDHDWRPFLALVTSGRALELYEPGALQQAALVLDLRKIHKIELLRDNKYEMASRFPMYNLGSLCLWSSSASHHMRADTRRSLDELHQALLDTWAVSEPPRQLDRHFLTQHDVPVALSKMVSYLQNHGTHIEGLFRRVGSVKEAERLWTELSIDPGSFVLNNCEPHDVASALKLFLRRLDEPLLTSRLYRYWIAATHIDDSERKFLVHRQLLDALPLVHYRALRCLIFLLVNIVHNADVTQMGPDNLGTSFNTCLLIGSDEAGVQFVPENLQVLPYLIRNYLDLFQVTQDELKIEQLFKDACRSLTASSSSGTSTSMGDNRPPPAQASLLRQIYLEPDLETRVESEIKLDPPASSSDPLASKQMRVEPGTTSASLITKLFGQTGDIELFEQRQIDDVPMDRLVYRHEFLVPLILQSEQAEQVHTRRWVFKRNGDLRNGLGNQACWNSGSCFRCWGSLTDYKKQVYIEISADTDRISVWKNDQVSEMLLHVQIKPLVLFRSSESSDRCAVAFEYKKTGPPATSTFPAILQRFAFKSRSSFTLIGFLSRDDYLRFLTHYDRAKCGPPDD